jgi:hypothetical protein
MLKHTLIESVSIGDILTPSPIGALVLRCEKDMPTTQHHGASLVQFATMIGALFVSEATTPFSLKAAETIPAHIPSLPPPRTCAPEDRAPFTEHELALFSPYLHHLPARALPPELTKGLILEGKMSAHRDGIVLDQKHLIFVSWDAQGVLFQKSALRQPSKSHTGVVALRTKVIASTSASGELAHTVQQISTLISFLPTSVDGIQHHVRVDPHTWLDRRGVRGCNWQGLDFLFKPNNYLPDASIAVSASRLIPVSTQVYQATIRRAFALGHQGKPYHVLSSATPNQDTENCITGVAGILDEIPGARRLHSTGPLRGQEATDYVARYIVAADGLQPNSRGYYDAPQDNWIMREFLRAVPSARTGILWYSLHRN